MHSPHFFGPPPTESYDARERKWNDQHAPLSPEERVAIAASIQFSPSRAAQIISHAPLRYIRHLCELAVNDDSKYGPSVQQVLMDLLYQSNDPGLPEMVLFHLSHSAIRFQHVALLAAKRYLSIQTPCPPRDSVPVSQGRTKNDSFCSIRLDFGHGCGHLTVVHAPRTGSIPGITRTLPNRVWPARFSSRRTRPRG